MADPSGSSSETALPTAAVTGSPSRGSRVPGRAIIAALCILLAIVLAAFLVQVLAPGPFPAPAAADDSPLPPVPADPTTGLTPDHANPDIAADRNSTRPLAITTFVAPVLSRTNTSPGTVIIVSGAAPSGCNPYAGTGGSRETMETDTALLEAKVHELVNSARQENGIPALGTDGALASVARAHSTDMAAHGYFGHINLRERDATARGAAAGYRCFRNHDTSFTYPITENLYADYRYDAALLTDCSLTGISGKTEEMLAAAAVDAWLKSPDHRINLLDPHVEREGIGVAVSEDDLIFVTENMC